MFLGADLLTLHLLLALIVVLGTSLLSLLLVGEKPQVLSQLYSGGAMIILNTCLLFLLVAKLVQVIALLFLDGLGEICQQVCVVDTDFKLGVHGA